LTSQSQCQRHTEDRAPPARVSRAFQEEEVELHLLDGWAETAAVPGDHLNLLANVEFRSGRRMAQVDFAAGLVVLHPDTLLSGQFGTNWRRT
jgi:hypothetical protein